VHGRESDAARVLTASVVSYLVSSTVAVILQLVNIGKCRYSCLFQDAFIRSTVQ